MHMRFVGFFCKPVDTSVPEHAHTPSLCAVCSVIALNVAAYFIICLGCEVVVHASGSDAGRISLYLFLGTPLASVFGVQSWAVGAWSREE